MQNVSVHHKEEELFLEVSSLKRNENVTARKQKEFQISRNKHVQKEFQIALVLCVTILFIFMFKLILLFHHFLHENSPFVLHSGHTVKFK